MRVEQFPGKVVISYLPVQYCYNKFKCHSQNMSRNEVMEAKLQILHNTCDTANGKIKKCILKESFALLESMSLSKLSCLRFIDYKSKCTLQQTSSVIQFTS